MPEFVIRQARADDAQAMAELMAAVAEERDGIATEPPVDLEALAGRFVERADGSVVADAGGRLVGMLNLDVSRHGFGEFGMLVDRDWRGRGVGSALLQKRSSGRAAKGCTSSASRCSRRTLRRSRSTGSAASSRKDGGQSSSGAQAASSGTRS
jgi:GNAT superfamily N-acetyltransferase